MKVVFDIDGVLYDFITALWLELRIYHGESHELTEFYASFYPAGYTNLYSKEIIDYYVSLEILYSRVPPKRNVIQFVNEIAKRNEVFYLTSRHEDLRFVTEWTLKEWGFPYLENVILSHNQPKSVFLNSIGADIFVEDMPKHVEDAQKNTAASVYMVDHPYNTWYNAKRIDSVLDLKGIL